MVNHNSITHSINLDAPELYTELYERVSRISGIPIENIEPHIKITKLNVSGRYLSVNHTILLSNKLSEIQRNIVWEHEGLHSIIELLANNSSLSNKRLLYYAQLSDSTFTDPKRHKKARDLINKYIREKHSGDVTTITTRENPQRDIAFEEPIAEHTTITSKATKEVLLHNNPKNETEKTISQRIENVKKFRITYGIDGLLLLIAESSEFDLKELSKFESLMIKRGYLNNGKVTKLGLRELRNTIINKRNISKKRELQERMKQSEKEREKWFPKKIKRKGIIERLFRI